MSTPIDEPERYETSCDVDGYTRTIEVHNGKRVWMCGNPRGCPTSGAEVEFPAPVIPHEARRDR